MSKTGIVGTVIVFLSLADATPVPAQTFEWMLPYEQHGSNVSGEDVQVSRNGEIFSQFSYWSLPPDRDSGTLLDKHGLSGNLVWRLGWSGQGSPVAVRFACHDNGDAYVLRIRPSTIREAALIKRASGAGTNWDTTLIGWYDKIAVSQDRIFLFGMLPDTGGLGTNRGFAIVQFDTVRNHRWRRDTLYALGTSITRTEIHADRQGSIYISGTVESNERDVFFLKYDIDGNLVCSDWVHGPVGRTEEGAGVTADDAGNFYILSKVDGSDNINAAWITKYDPTGREIWSRAFASEKNLGLQSIHTTSDGDIVVAGGYDGQAQLVVRVDSSGAMQWRMPVDSMFTFRTMDIGPDNALYFSNLNPGWTPRSNLRYFAKYSFQPVSVETPQDRMGVLTTCELAQNYPNPFNPSTSIEFRLPSRGDVRLAVYDPLGREVAVLAEGTYEAGIHACPFTGTELPSAVYLYRLSWNGRSAVRRMMLLR